MKQYHMIMEPPRGGLKEGLQFGYVDVPAVMTEKDRPFLNELTANSMNLQREIRKEEIDGLQVLNTVFAGGGRETKVRVYIPDKKEKEKVYRNLERVGMDRMTANVLVAEMRKEATANGK